MGAPILNKNKSARLEVADIINQYSLKGSKEIRYTIRLYRKEFNAIPLVNGVPYQPGDKVVILFQDTNVMDTPFIIGKYNQKSFEDEKILSSMKSIEKPKDPNAILYETDNSFIKLDGNKRRITIGNKDTEVGKIYIDNDQVFVGNTNLSKLILDMEEFIQKKNNDSIINSIRNLTLDAIDGNINGKAKEINLLSTNFTIRNKSDMLIETSHLNFTASAFEFNVITPNAYDFSISNAYSFSAVDGDYSISLGMGDFDLIAISPLSTFSYLISPLPPFIGVKSSLAGMSIDAVEILMGVGRSVGLLDLTPYSFETKILKGSSSIKLTTGTFGVNIGFGLVNIKLTPMSFSVTIAGNKLTLSPTGLTIASGNITATSGDVEALSGIYSLMMHMHQTSIPGPPSPPTPMPPV